MENYDEIMQQLKAPFPNGTVQFTKSKRPYIPNQVYTDRLETVTRSQWTKIIKDLDISIEHRYVKAIVSVCIGEHSRDGYGMSIINGNPTDSPAEIPNAVDQAINSAFIEALDSYQMGWRNLAPFKMSEKEWGSNPALSHLLATGSPEQSSMSAPNAAGTHICIKCSAPLKHAEWELLKHVPKLNLAKMVYCYNDLPSHYKRTIPEDKLQTYLDQIAD